MKFRLYGKVQNRTYRKVKRADGTSYDLYSMVIEEPGKYPQVFQVSTKDATAFGAKDGPFAIGKFVTAEGFINGNVRDLTSKDGHPFKSYNIYLTLTKIEPAIGVPEESAAPSDAAMEDIPF